MNPALQILATMIAGWLNEQQQLAIEYLKEENRVVFQDSTYVIIALILML
jgi:hypothetical protein